ncbi:MAG: gamma-glutamyltransferase family protein [Pseudomonadota bacterium]
MAGRVPIARTLCALASGTLLGLLLAGCGAPAVTGSATQPGLGPSPADTVLPEAATPGRAAPAGSTPRPSFAREAVAAAHPLASEAGAALLAAGGNALDAAIGAQFVLSVVEPQASGLGGGGFLLHWDGREVAAWDGRETAPAAAGPDWFLRADGTPLPMAAAVASGRSVGVPGLVSMLEAAHRAHGRLPWARLLQPAIALAEQGHAVGPRLHALLQAEMQGSGALARDPQARAHFLDAEGRPWPVGHVLRNPAQAAVLRAVARDGAAALHRGAVAADIVRRAAAHGAPGAQPAPAGRMTAADLERYRPQRRAALCADWAPHWRVCGMPPPSAGQLTLMQTLGIVERLGPGAAAPPAGVGDADWLHRFTEAQRLAFADRNRHVGDPDFVAPPSGRWDSLLDAGYLDARAARGGPRRMGLAPGGAPAAPARALAAPAAAPEGGTTHVSVVDAVGRAVALTSSIEAMFGARLMSDGGTGLPGGFLLNNQLTDFSFVPSDAQGRPLANRVEGGKRPRSSMSPTLVFDRRDGRLAMVTGSALGAHIIPAVARTLVGTLRWQLHPQDAVALPQVSALNGPTLLEAGRFEPAVVQALRERGHEVVEQPLPTGLSALAWRDGAWHGAADPRREGAVRGR